MGSYPPPSPSPPSSSDGTVYEDDLAPPEVLPPSGGTMGPPSVRRSRSRWLGAPATYLLVGINCAVFLWMLSRGVSPMNPTVDQLMHFGADNAGNVLESGEWYRIVTAMFVHVGFIHLATNMWCLWNLGLLAEPLIGSIGVRLAVYILTGAAGNLLSTLVNWISYRADWTTLHDLGDFPRWSWRFGRGLQHRPAH